MDAAVASSHERARLYFSPLKVYDYEAEGRAVVASRIGQLEKLIEPERNGLLVPPGDVAALTAALDRLRQDPEMRFRLGNAARATVLNDHTWDSVAHRILSFAGLQPPRRTAAPSPAGRRHG